MVFSLAIFIQQYLNKLIYVVTQMCTLQVLTISPFLLHWVLLICKGKIVCYILQRIISSINMLKCETECFPLIISLVSLSTCLGIYCSISVGDYYPPLTPLNRLFICFVWGLYANIVHNLSCCHVYNKI